MMKKVLMFLLALTLAFSATAQKTTKPVDPKVAEQKQKQQEKIAEQKQKQAEEREKQKQKIAEQKQKQQEKLAEQKQKQQEKLNKNKTSNETTKPNTRRKKEDPNAVEPDPEVVQLYFQLPISALPQVKDYIKVMKPLNNNDDLRDGKDLRRSFIAKTDANRQYINLQRPGETKYTRIQEFKTKDFKRILAIETNACTGICNNDLKFYRNENSEWKDVTSEYMYKVEPKVVLKKIKDKYKEEYMDTELYDSKSYEDSTGFAKAINYNISLDENKIVIRDQYLSLPLYEMKWNQEKGKFDIKKL
jgi:hypothetical protein